MTPATSPVLSEPELRDLWYQDCIKLVPDFVLFDEVKMLYELDKIKSDLGAPELSDIETLVTVIRNMEQHLVDVPAAWFWVYTALILFPEMEDNPWFQVLWWTYEDMRGKRQVTTLWGSASSSKSSFFASMVITSLVVWNGCAHAYISCPYKNSAEDKIFKEITKRTEVWAKDPPLWSEQLQLRVRSVNNNASIINASNQTSSCVLVSLETTAQVQGFKVARLEGPNKYNARMGAMIFVGDELIINPAACQEYWIGTGNLVSNNNFMGWVGMNPLPHQVKHPNAIMLSAPQGRDINTLKEFSDFTWPTARGRLLRLCMANSPNRHQYDPIFPYLVNHEQAAIAEAGGDITRQAQVAAWGWSGGVGNGGVLSLGAVLSPHVQSCPVWADMLRSRVVFFDIAFGGKDPAGYCALEAGLALINGQSINVVSIIEQGVMAITKRWTPTTSDIEEYNRLATARGGVAPILQAGQEMDADTLVPLQMLRVADRLGIPKGRVSFDSSLRPDVTILCRNALGHVPWYYDGTRALKDDETAWPLFPPVMKADGYTAKKWSDNHNRVISAAWRFSEHLISAGHVHNLSAASKGCQELLSRPWVMGNDKSDLLGKKDLAVSPMYAETLALSLVFAYRFGGALPQLLSTAPIVIGGSFASKTAEESLFKLKVRPAYRWR